MLDPDRFGITVARNRGLFANVFTSETEALAWLLVGWLCSRLDWSRHEEMPVVVEEMAGEQGVLSLSLGERPEGDIHAVMDPHCVVVRYQSGVTPFRVSVPHEHDADAVATELRGLGRDVCLRESLLTLAERFAKQP